MPSYLPSAMLAVWCIAFWRTYLLHFLFLTALLRHAATFPMHTEHSLLHTGRQRAVFTALFRLYHYLCLTPYQPYYSATFRRCIRVAAPTLRTGSHWPAIPHTCNIPIAPDIVRPALRFYRRIRWVRNTAHTPAAFSAPGFYAPPGTATTTIPLLLCPVTPCMPRTCPYAYHAYPHLLPA